MADQLNGPDPSMHRRRLRAELRRTREAVGRTQREAAAAMDWSMSKLIRIETGEVKITVNDLRALLSYYGVAGDRVDSLVEVARSAREQARWAIYRDVASPEFLAFLGYESSAAVIRSFQPILVPGLLQTEEYAAEVISKLEEPPKVEPMVDLRIQRQEILTRPSPPRINFVVDEAVVRRVVGGPAVMRRQLEQIRQIAELPHVTFRVVPYSAGAYPRMSVAYVLFEFSEAQDEDVLYIENIRGEDVIREHSVTERTRNTPAKYLSNFSQLEPLAPESMADSILDNAISSLDR